MPDTTEVRKRSRSPSDSDTHQQSHKRVNTGAPASPRSDSKNDEKESPPVSPSSTSKKEDPPAPPAAQIHMRCLIVTQDASIIIGKAGKHVNEIREKSGARVMVSESIPGNPERILNVSGPLDAVSKVYLISCILLSHTDHSI